MEGNKKLDPIDTYLGMDSRLVGNRRPYSEMDGDDKSEASFINMSMNEDEDREVQDSA